MSGMRFLVTGASGFVGQHMVQLLASEGHAVAGLYRTPPPILPTGVEAILGDLEDMTSLRYVPKAWDAVVHLAGSTIPSQFDSLDAVLVNLRTTLNLLEHLESGRVLLASSCHVYAPSAEHQTEDSPIAPRGRYGLSKHLVEQTAAHYGGKLDIRIGRPFNHLGPGLRPELAIPSLIRRLASLPVGDPSPVVMEGYDSIRDFIDVRDVTSAYLAILLIESPAHRVFNVCTGKGRSIGEVATCVLDLLGQRREVQFRGKPNSSDDSVVLVGSPARLMASTDWRPRISLEDSLRSLVAVHQPHP